MMVGAGFVSKLQGKGLTVAVRLVCGHRLAEAALQEHGMLRVVLPSAAHSHSLPEPQLLGGLHGSRLSAATRMHIVCGDVRYPLAPGQPTDSAPKPDTVYLGAYTTALHSALSAEGNPCLTVTSLHMEVF